MSAKTAEVDAEDFTTPEASTSVNQLQAATPQQCFTCKVCFENFKKLCGLSSLMSTKHKVRMDTEERNNLSKTCKAPRDVALELVDRMIAKVVEAKRSNNLILMPPGSWPITHRRFEEKFQAGADKRRSPKLG